jgi:hypothetical protein
MNKKILFSALAASIMLAAGSVLPASAALGLNASAGLSVKLDVTARARADAQIDARITALNNLEARIGQMTKVTSDQKASLDASIQASINDMTALKAKIDADTDNATLKADIQSITKSYRIYILVLPQGRITAAADRIITIVGLFNDLSLKLQARISAAQAAGQNVTALNASLSDMNAKTADANVQAQAAINEVVVLKPDNGDKTIMASNDAALKDARAKLKVAMGDLKTARQDAGSIVKALIAIKVGASAGASATSTMGQ